MSSVNCFNSDQSKILLSNNGLKCGQNIFPGNLRQHERTHTAQKIYQCPYCPDKFTSRSILKYHVVIHSGLFSFLLLHWPVGLLSCLLCMYRCEHASAHPLRKIGFYGPGLLFLHNILRNL